MKARRITEQLSQHLDLLQTHRLVGIHVGQMLWMGNVDGEQRCFKVQQSLPVTGKRVFYVGKVDASYCSTLSLSGVFFGLKAQKQDFVSWCYLLWVGEI